MMICTRSYVSMYDICMYIRLRTFILLCHTRKAGNGQNDFSLEANAIRYVMYHTYTDMYVPSGSDCRVIPSTYVQHNTLHKLTNPVL